MASGHIPIFGDPVILYLLCMLIIILNVRSVFKDITIRENLALRASATRVCWGLVIGLCLPFVVKSVGFVTGAVDDFRRYDPPDFSNIYVVFYYAILLVEVIIFSFWVFFRKGDRKIWIIFSRTETVNLQRVSAQAIAILLLLYILHYFWIGITTH